jgi:hypothetical protein
MRQKTFSHLKKIADTRHMTDAEYIAYLDYLREKSMIIKRRKAAKVHQVYKTFPINLN